MSKHTNVGHQKTTEFINQLESLAQGIDGKNVNKIRNGENNEKEYLELLVKEARELLQYNEWLVALENTIDNLCEIDYKLEDEVIQLAVMALEAANTRSDRIELIKFLKKIKA